MADLFQSHSRSARLDWVLSHLLGQAPELQAAAVVSFDGLPMASALPAGMDEDRVAAMSAALLSLGERASESFGRGSLTQVYVEGDAGTVFLVSADDEAVLVAVGASGAKVGLLMYEVRRAAVQVAQALRADDAAAAEQFEAEAARSELSVLADPEPTITTAPVYDPQPAEPVVEQSASRPYWADQIAESVSEPEPEYASEDLGEYASDYTSEPVAEYEPEPVTEPAPALHVVEPLPEQEPAAAGWGTSSQLDAPADAESGGELDEPEAPEAQPNGPWGSPITASASSESMGQAQPNRGNWTVYSPGPSDSYWS
jgi:uncharacterized protein